jgi:molybdopterin-containing oxidoreductase family membrane subunit
VRRPFGPYASAYWAMWIFNALAPQLLWIRSFRRRALPLLLVSVGVLVGMWLERFVLIVTSLDRDFLPSSWQLYAPTWVDWSLVAGTLGLFSFLFLLFVRFVPMVPIYEIKRLRHELELGHGG